MAITTLCNRYFLDEGATHPRIPLLVLPLCIIWVTACDWAFLTVPFYALWLSDDILSWRRLRYHPGPWFAGISSLPTLWHIRKGDFYHWQQRSHKKHGGIALKSWLIVSGRRPYMVGTGIGPNRLTTSDGAFIHKLDSKKHGTPRSEWYGAAINPSPFHERNVTKMTDGEHHEQYRKRLTAAYNSFDMFKALHHSAEVHIKEPIEKHLAQASDDITRIIDFAPIVERFALQAFSNMASGQVRRHTFVNGGGR